MSNSDFEDRIRRIQGNAAQRQASATHAPNRRGVRYGRLALGAVAMSLGIQTLRFVNEGYDWVRDQHGVLAAVGLGLGGAAAVVTGCVLVYRAVAGTRGDRMTDGPRPPVRTSAGARLFFSLFGLGLGGLASFILYVANAGRQLGVTGQVDAETARGMAIGSTLLAFLLVFLALLIGLIGLFVRGLPMRRVPVFFLLGAMLLYTSFQTLRIHPTNWPVFMAEFTRAFTNRGAD